MKDIPFQRYASAVSAFAAYRPAGIGALRVLPTAFLGIPHYSAGEIASLDLDAVKARAAEVDAELVTLEESEKDWTEEGGEATKHEELSAELGHLTARGKTLIDRSKVRAAAANVAATEPASIPAVQVNGGRSKANPFDLDELRYGVPLSELRGRAKAAVESIDYIDDLAKGEAIRKIEKVSDPRGVIPGLILRTGHPDYQTAFHKGLAGRMDLWTDAERRAVAAVEEFRTAMSLTDANGGYAIPFTLDPSVILTNAGTTNPVRRIARIETTTTDNWNGLTTAGVTASFDAENAEVSDDSPTFTQPAITVRMARAFVQGSVAISQDFANLAGELATLFADARDRLEGAKFWSGASGSNEPVGIETTLAGGSSVLTPTTTEVFAVADIYKVLNNLPARHRQAGPSWTAEVSTINAIRQFATANNYHAFLTDLGAGQPAQMLGYPLYEWSDMDAYSAVDTAATATNHILLLGDFRKYIVVDRIGGSIEFIPHLFATANNLPSFTRGWVYYWRVGADSLDDGAFRLLNLATTA